MSKDRKSKTVYHINKDLSSNKAYANARKKETVDVKWESTPSWTIMTYNPDSKDTSKDYFKDKGNDSE